MPGSTPRGASARAVDEESPLLGRVANKSESSHLSKHLRQDVSRNWADAVLLFGYIITGLLDSSAVFIWGSFVSMQTGESAGASQKCAPNITARKHRLPWLGNHCAV